MRMERRDEEIYIELETAANRFTLRCVCFTVLLMGVVLLLNVTGVFIIDLRLSVTGFGLGSLVLLLTLVMCYFFGVSKPWIKYVLIAAVIVATTILGVMLPYHTILLCVLPILYSAQYNRKMVYFAYGLTLISMFIIVMGGYYVGICDANMLGLTVQSRDHYIDFNTNTIVLGQVNPNPWVTLPLYYVLPRMIILLTMIPVIRHIADGIVQKAEREKYLKQLSENDDMTGLYNRNKYKQMVKEYYPLVDQLGVIFLDVNRLKHINDTLGHEHGDQMIISVAKMIRELLTDNSCGFRIGGDEFVVIMEDVTREQVEAWMQGWKTALKEKNETIQNKLSVAYGYAIGEGKNIEELIRIADFQMYEKKGEYER